MPAQPSAHNRTEFRGLGARSAQKPATRSASANRVRRVTLVRCKIVHTRLQQTPLSFLRLKAQKKKFKMRAARLDSDSTWLRWSTLFDTDAGMLRTAIVRPRWPCAKTATVAATRVKMNNRAAPWFHFGTPTFSRT